MSYITRSGIKTIISAADDVPLEARAHIEKMTGGVPASRFCEFITEEADWYGARIVTADDCDTEIVAMTVDALCGLMIACGYKKRHPK